MIASRSSSILLLTAALADWFLVMLFLVKEVLARVWVVVQHLYMVLADMVNCWVILREM